MTEENKTVQRWADTAMYTAEPSDATNGPRVYLLSAPADPLGEIAALCAIYEGRVVRNLGDVSDEDRKRYLKEMQKTKLTTPLETVQFHFLIEGVTRAFTHQLVRQRTAAYAQESMRFAVIEDNFTERVALPPSLAGTVGEAMQIRQEIIDRDGYLERFAVLDSAVRELTPGWREWEQRFDRLSEPEKHRYRWDLAVTKIQNAYQALVEGGMPAEDARGLLPTNITTRIHYVTNLRGLLDHAGNRLCTQAQFEWRLVFAEIAKTLRNYGSYGDIKYKTQRTYNGINGPKSFEGDEESNWQYHAIASLLKPVCYQMGECKFKADFDRKCSIRGRVDANAAIGRPSDLWHLSNDSQAGGEVEAINPAEWLADPSAAR